MGAWWLLREVEIATLRARLVVRSRGTDGAQQVFLNLPASKADQEARGAARGHRCQCSRVAARTACPVCCIRDQVAFLRRQFPAAWRGEEPDWTLPLFPSLAGTVCAKPAFVQTILAAATQLAVPLASPDGACRISGHSLRVSGAQGLTRLGYPLWAVQLLGRWGGDSVKSYVGDAALEVFTESVQTGTGSADALDVVLAAAGRTDQPATAPIPRSRAAPDTAEVQRVATRVAGDLIAELGAALRAELEVELASRVPPTPSKSGAACGPARVLVENDRTGCIHVVGVGQESGRSSHHWQSLCGWFFGQFGGFTIAGGASQAPTCERCLKKCSS